MCNLYVLIKCKELRLYYFKTNIKFGPFMHTVHVTVTVTVIYMIKFI